MDAPITEPEHLYNTTETGTLSRLVVMLRDDMFVLNYADTLACIEVDTIARFLDQAMGERDAAVRWLIRHTAHDRDDDSHPYPMSEAQARAYLDDLT